jgi:hypothetical protein
MAHPCAPAPPQRSARRGVCTCWCRRGHPTGPVRTLPSSPTSLMAAAAPLVTISALPTHTCNRGGALAALSGRPACHTHAQPPPGPSSRRPSAPQRRSWAGSCTRTPPAAWPAGRVRACVSAGGGGHAGVSACRVDAPAQTPPRPPFRALPTAGDDPVRSVRGGTGRVAACGTRRTQTRDGGRSALVRGHCRPGGAAECGMRSRARALAHRWKKSRSSRR